MSFGLRRTVLLGWVGISLFAATWLGCGPAKEDTEISDVSEVDESLGAVAGSIEVDGSSTVFPITEAAATKFNKNHPEIKVVVGYSGTGNGFKRFAKGEIDICDASRPIKQPELDLCRAAHIEFIELPVAYDGLTIVVNKENDWLKELTIGQLQKIYLEEGAAKNWSDVDPSWPNEPIIVYSPGEDSGTYDYFNEVVAKDDQKLRTDMSMSENDNVLVTGVAGEKGAIGYFGASYYFENKERLTAVPIVNPKTGVAVAPNATTIEDGTYAPFSRPLFIYVKADVSKRPEMVTFVEFYLENAKVFAEEVKYVALPQEVYDLAGKHFADRLTGTHYLTDDGKKREGAVPHVYTIENLLK
jgi:phosphate transport system substrate-binding protein